MALSEHVIILSSIVTSVLLTSTQYMRVDPTKQCKSNAVPGFTYGEKPTRGRPVIHLLQWMRTALCPFRCNFQQIICETIV